MIKKFLIFSCVIVLFAGCVDTGPRPKSMVGTYKVSVKMKEVKASGDVENSKRGEGIFSGKEKPSVKDESTSSGVELDNIDTTSVEGKILYTARRFERSMKELEGGFEALGKNLGNLMEGLAQKGSTFKNNWINNLSFEVELQEDGGMKTRGIPLDFIMMKEPIWLVEGDTFYILNGGEKKYSFKIVEKSTNLIKLENEEVFIFLNRV